MSANSLFADLDVEEDGKVANVDGRSKRQSSRKKPSPISAEAVPQPRGRGKKRIVFGWYGGKFNHLGWLVPLLPPCHHYCEPFAGSAACPPEPPAIAGGDL